MAEELLGVQDGMVKMYLDVEYCELEGTEDKEELMVAKQLEINNIFNKYLSDVPSVKALKHYKSAPHLPYYQPTREYSELMSQHHD